MAQSEKQTNKQYINQSINKLILNLVDIDAVLSISGVSDGARSTLESLVGISAVDAWEARVGFASRNHFVAGKSVALESRRTRTAPVTVVGVRATDAF